MPDAQAPAAIDPVMLTGDDAATLSRMSSASFQRLVAQRKMPPPLKPSPGISRWHRPTLEKFLATCAAEGEWLTWQQFQALEAQNGRGAGQGRPAHARLSR